MHAYSAWNIDASQILTRGELAKVLADLPNAGDAVTPGATDFAFRGAGFSADQRIRVSVPLSGVTNTSNLVEAINTAIDAAGNAGSQQSTAFKNAGVRAIVVQDKQADGTVEQRPSWGFYLTFDHAF